MTIVARYMSSGVFFAAARGSLCKLCDMSLLPLSRGGGRVSVCVCGEGETSVNYFLRNLLSVSCRDVPSRVHCHYFG